MVTLAWWMPTLSQITTSTASGKRLVSCSRCSVSTRAVLRDASMMTSSPSKLSEPKSPTFSFWPGVGIVAGWSTNCQL